MKIMISACLLGVNCKYNGGNNYSEKVAEYIKGKKIIPICPEVLGGLPTPRSCAEIIDGIVTTREGKCVDREFRSGANIALQRAIMEKPDIVILQSRSPSCGVKQIYDGKFTGNKKSGQGIFAELLILNGFNVMEVEDL